MHLQNLTGSAGTFISLNTTFERARNYYSFVEQCIRDVAKNTGDPRERANLNALAEGHKRLWESVERTRLTCLFTDRYFQVVPESPAFLTRLPAYNPLEPNAFLNATQELDADWIRTLHGMEIQSPGGGRINESLHNLVSELEEIQRRTSLRVLTSSDI